LLSGTYEMKSTRILEDFKSIYGIFKNNSSKSVTDANTSKWPDVQKQRC